MEEKKQITEKNEENTTKKYNEFKDKSQEAYYKRIKSFLYSNKKILLNPGGMGLGKTWASIKALSESPLHFGFIAVPTSPLKNVWSEEFNNFGLLGEYALAFSKDSCCIKKINNGSFKPNSKNCRDDCIYWKDLQKNGDYTFLAEQELTKLDKKLPTWPRQYYDSEGCKSCLMPICRLGLKKRKYIIADYFYFLNRGIFTNVINSNDKIYKLQSQGTLVIDEAHLVPERTKDFLSKTLNFSKTIEKLEEEIRCDSIKNSLRMMHHWQKTIRRLKVLNDEVIKNRKDVESRYNYDDFCQDYESIKESESFNISELRHNLKVLAKEGYNVDSDEGYEDEDLACVKMSNFLNLWEEKLKDPTYRHYFQYKNISKDNLRFIIDCCDTSKYLQNIFNGWDRIILNSGTIPDKEYFNYQTGLSYFDRRSLVQDEPLIESYSIKDNVIIYANGDFKTTSREKTYKEISETLNKILEELGGRTIIYIQNKFNSIVLKKMLKTNLPIIDFCSKDDGFATNQEDWLKLEGEFNRKKDCLAIMNINGRVEGFNFLDEENGNPVDNIIILGYPFPRRGLSYQDQEKYYTELIKDSKTVRKWLDYTPVLIRIHQAVCRAKRSENHQPRILLWDNNFGSKKLAYNYMPDDLKGKVCWKSEDVLQEINRIKKKKVENGTNP